MPYVKEKRKEFFNCRPSNYPPWKPESINAKSLCVLVFVAHSFILSSPFVYNVHWFWEDEEEEKAEQKRMNSLSLICGSLLTIKYKIKKEIQWERHREMCIWPRSLFLLAKLFLSKNYEKIFKKSLYLEILNNNFF